MQLRSFLLYILSLPIIHSVSDNNICEFSTTLENKLYTYSLASSSDAFPHGVLSEDGYYKVSSNGTVIWFQLCDGMIFNHDPPKCFDCMGCGGSSQCGMGCGALMSNDILGYPVCTTIGRTQTITADLIDKNTPDKGIVVKMWHQGVDANCSLSVSVVCDSKQVQGPKTIERLSGLCNFATQIMHPAGCGSVLVTRGSGLGWFGTLFITILCLLGGYLLAGAAYRHFYLGIGGIDIIPNLEFWASLPHRARSAYTSLLRRFRGPSQNYRSSYSPVDF